MNFIFEFLTREFTSGGTKRVPLELSLCDLYFNPY